MDSSLAGMKNREERSQHFFDTSAPLMDDGEDNTLYDRVRDRAASCFRSSFTCNLCYRLPEAGGPTARDWQARL